MGTNAVAIYFSEARRAENAVWFDELSEEKVKAQAENLYILSTICNKNENIKF